jgi:hypothetical protein
VVHREKLALIGFDRERKMGLVGERELRWWFPLHMAICGNLQGKEFSSGSSLKDIVSCCLK